MAEKYIKERILTVLFKNGPMTSNELCEKLELEWTEFSGPLGEMIKNIFNPGGKVIQERKGDITTYRLA